ncbi:putative lipid II flippase FtsW [Paenibacillus turpanensis]|uniref:putative lipid II flippase FtsW n=1 Tax=Paenibacillus turpanensis TaxID=2689078 RepID=UPI00140CEACB|nr:putative lipid II flippase FtsW [Paenibacillus turpanensis]
MNSSKRGTPDFLLLILTFILVCFGLVMVFSSSSATAAADPDIADKFYYLKKQVIWVILGSIGMLTLMNIHYSKLKKWFLPYLIVVMVMLVIVLFRPPVNGAHSWLQIGNLGIQPAEFAKLSIILYLSALISKKGEKFRDFQSGLLPVIVMVGLLSSLIFMQPDFGSSVIFLACAFTVILTGGANLKHLFSIIGIIGATGAVFIGIYALIKQDLGYRFDRVTCFLDPWSDTSNACYQILQSRYAFGHGGLTGTGIGRSVQKLHYLPEAHNDFIFAIVGEELGFIGTSLFLLAYLLFIWRGLIVALRCPDLFGTLIGTGVMGMLGAQAFINIGGVTGAIPSTGVTLPFISYGGSSLLVCMFSMGILLSVSREQQEPNASASYNKKAVPVR